MSVSVTATPVIIYKKIRADEQREERAPDTPLLAYICHSTP